MTYLVVFCYVPYSREYTEPGYGDNMLTTVHISADTLSLRSCTLTNMPRHSTSLNTPLTSATSSAHLARSQHQSHGHDTRPIRYIQHITWAATNVVPPLRTPLPRCENGLDTNAIRMHTPCPGRHYDDRNTRAGYLEDVGAHSASPMAREGGSWQPQRKHQAAPNGSRTAIRRPARYSNTGSQSAMRRRRRRR
ncbi:hypothetical protein BJ912DRAFT_990312 [Pholiota molesta]|nr:hypothetical protein BJ912DRAFT_990312 [Pholiota molesta]